MGTLTIGKLAKAAEVGIDTVRFYERAGLLKKPQRTAAGYRLYAESVLRVCVSFGVPRRWGFLWMRSPSCCALTTVVAVVALYGLWPSGVYGRSSKSSRS
jgi:hypothetical protein